jgi:hypothetical protein
MSTEHKTHWIPRHRELPVACASCPFREGNDAEFAVIVNRLRKHEGLKPVVPHGSTVKQVRSKVRVELLMLGTGEFHCHCTAYNEDMTSKPLHAHRQCAGAAEWYRKYLTDRRTLTSSARG